jgi:serine/threonine protein kinase
VIKTASSAVVSTPESAAGGGIGPGARLGRDELRERIGAGGMSEVYRALQHVPGGLKRSVVVKLIRPDRLAEPGAEDRFLDEARNSLGLQHPHIVAVHDFGREQGQWFLVLEEVSGPSLSALLAALARLSVPMAEDEALLIAADLAGALEHVHGQVDETGRLLGLVHRDLCAANVLLSRRAEAKLGDFGVSRVAGAGQPIEGHLATMAPEQLSGGAVGPPADVWALGVVLWEMLTGRRLFPQNSVSEQLSVVRAGPLPAPSTRRAGLRPGLDALLSLMLEADPRLRPSAAAVHVELMGLLGPTLAPRLALAERLAQLFPAGPEPIGRGELSPGPADEAAATVMISRPSSVSGPAAAPVGSPEPAGRPEAADSTGSLQLPPRRLRALLPVVLASALVVIGASAWVLRGQAPEGPRVPPEAPPSAPAATAPLPAPPLTPSR